MCRHRPALIGLDRYKSGADRPGLFYGVIDTQVVLNGPKRYDILKILIKYVIKYKMRINYAIIEPGSVGAGLVPVHSGQGQSVPVGAGVGAGTGSPR